MTFLRSLFGNRDWTSSEIGQNKLNFKLVFPISEEVYCLNKGAKSHEVYQKRAIRIGRNIGTGIGCTVQHMAYQSAKGRRIMPCFSKNDA